ncbi:integrin alpha-PS5-like [Macrosteles quadrilineatus]|uniref:integrin alpha-PS5-like n=1 Tax=Macrosteles quadrilineatus TaxID=74068 RepID=UPI0023E0BA72|nr:integrin alpha-PS5-like [Macrosteles quadrilineatus]
MSGAHQSTWSIETRLEGQQMGEYFGACVTSVDVNIDGVDDLVLVGAPQHSLQHLSTIDTGEQGILYVYRNVKEGRLELTSMVITGSSAAGARFASSVSVIGDLNKDGYNDVAVGAPYEGVGAVYIYLGGRHGLNSNYAQRISASDIRSDLRGFGFSLASGIDIDGNSFTDLAVGSYDSANAVIIRSYPVIEMEAYLRPAVSNLDVNANNITITACLEYTINTNSDLMNYVDATAILKADPTLKRAFFELGDHLKETHIRLQKDVTHCWDNYVILKGNLLQKMQPVEFSLNYKVADKPSMKNEKRFCKLCPVTDPLKPTSVHVKIPFANGCGGKSMCLADLRVLAESSTEGQAIVLGQDKTITVEVNIINMKEPAYLVRMSLSLPKSTSLVKIPQRCYQEEDESLDDPEIDQIVCGFGNILETDQLIPVSRRTTKFEIDVSSVGLETSMLVFNITTWSASEEQMPADNTKIITVPVKLVGEMEISGNTMQKHLVLSSKNETLPSVISIVHKYQVTNFGPSPVGELMISSSLPFGLLVDESFGMIIFGENINPQLTIKGHTVRCSVDYSTLNLVENQSRRKREVAALESNEVESYLTKNIFHLNCTEAGLKTAACALVTCRTGLLNFGDTAEMKLQFNINRTMIDLIQQQDVIQISSSASVKIPDEYDIYFGKRLRMASVATVLVGNFEETISPLVLIVSALLGLLLLALLVTILSKTGFFHRKYREDMKTMKTRDVTTEFAYQAFLPEFENNIFY